MYLGTGVLEAVRDARVAAVNLVGLQHCRDTCTIGFIVAAHSFIEMVPLH